MATKTISIDIDAYNRLDRARRGGETFSQTLKRIIFDPAAFEEMLKRTAKDPLSDDAIAAIEEVVAARRKPARPSRRTG